MSNNIYDILKKFNNLDSVKNILNEGKGSKPDFLDMDKDGDKKEPMKKAAKEKSKGAVAEAVAQVERQLNEKYQGFKKAAAADKKMVKELDPNLKDPESEWFHSRGQIAPVAAYTNDEQGQKQYKDRTSGGVINKVKDFVGYDKPNPAYGPKDTKVKEGDYNEDMLSPGQKKIARMSPPPDKIDANDLKALRAGKDKKKEGNAFSGAMAKAKASGQDEFNVGGKEYAVKEGSPKKKTQSPDEQHKVVAGVRDAMRKGYDNVQKGRDERAAARFVAKLKYGINDSEKTNEGFPTVADAEKRMREKEGKTAHGKKTTTAAGTRHERDYDAVDKGADVDMTPKGRGRPKKDRFAQ